MVVAFPVLAAPGIDTILLHPARQRPDGHAVAAPVVREFADVCDRERTGVGIVSFPSDLDIARQANLRPLTDIASAAGIPLDLIEPYGSGAAKIDLRAIEAMADRPRAKYVVVSAITPTPLGEGKTTVAVGLSQGFSHIDKNATLAIRHLGERLANVGGQAERLLVGLVAGEGFKKPLVAPLAAKHGH